MKNYIGIALIMLILWLLPSCSSNGPVAFKTKKYVYYKGNYRNFYLRQRADSIRKANLEAWNTEILQK